ncbi:arylalkylamine N-acetyltransferase-like 2 [Musca domestica]|uniref:aralkylamine N-acetyltransferase n=1 Tax=Musca domestica TaxID=7370 RepID=A0A1I8MHF8_MUSDO|nr:arylalkylamine N-acetyltransferase-like 2 [Musca domestica]
MCDQSNRNGNKNNNKSSNADIQMKIIATEDCDKVIKFLWENFFPYAPLAGSEPKWIPSREDEMVLREGITKHNCSIVAMKEDQIIGVSIALPKNRSAADEYFEAAKKAGKNKHGYIMQLLGEIMCKTDIFNRYGVEETLYVYLVSVAPNQRGRNIAYLMMRELMRVGKEKKFEVLSIDCSSYYCAQVCERLGMECLSTVPFSDYLDEKGEVIFRPSPPHVAMETYAQRLQ